MPAHGYKYINQLIRPTDNGDCGVASTRFIASGRRRITVEPDTIVEYDTEIKNIDTINAEPLVFDASKANVYWSSPNGVFFNSQMRGATIDILRCRTRPGAGPFFNRCTLNYSNVQINIFAGLASAAPLWFGREGDTAYNSILKVDYIQGSATGNTPETGPSFIDHKTESIDWRSMIVDFGFAYGHRDNYIIDVATFHQAGSRMSGNEFRVHTSETSVGGIIRLRGHHHPVIKVESYDLSTPAEAHAVSLGSMSIADIMDVIGTAPAHVQTIAYPPRAIVTGPNGLTYASNDDIPANTPFAIGTAGETWEELKAGTDTMHAEIQYKREGGRMELPYYDLYLEDARWTDINVMGHNNGNSLATVDANGHPANARNAERTRIDNDENVNYANSEQLDWIEKIISGGSITIDEKNWMLLVQIDTESAGAEDELTTILGGRVGQKMLLRTVVSGRDVVVAHGPDLSIGADFTLDRFQDTVELLCIAPNQWVGVSRSDNR